MYQFCVDADCDWCLNGRVARELGVGRLGGRSSREEGAHQFLISFYVTSINLVYWLLWPWTVVRLVPLQAVLKFRLSVM